MIGSDKDTIVLSNFVLFFIKLSHWSTDIDKYNNYTIGPQSFMNENLYITEEPNIYFTL